MLYQLSHFRSEQARAGVVGAESQSRTGDTAIFSRVLYQLSYLGLNVHTLFPGHAYCTYMQGDCQAKR